MEGSILINRVQQDYPHWPNRCACKARALAARHKKDRRGVEKDCMPWPGPMLSLRRGNAVKHMARYRPYDLMAIR